MNRPIEYRGKRIDNGEWVEGYYFTTPLTNENVKAPIEDGHFFLCGIKRHVIVRNNAVFEIDPATLCEYSGRDDINGAKIFEHDMVQIGFVRADKSILWYGVMEVTFKDGAFMLGTDPLCKFTDARLKVIGNVFDGRAQG